MSPTDAANLTAPGVLHSAIDCIAERAAARGVEAERSMGRTVNIFTAITGHTLSEREGWVFMIALNLARAQGGALNLDDYIDGAAYFALAGECAQGAVAPLDPDLENLADYLHGQAPRSRANNRSRA